MDFQWVVPPEYIARNIDAYGEKILTAVHAVADHWAQEVQNDMRLQAQWTDRTGNARSGLFTLVQQAATDLVEIYLSSSLTAIEAKAGHTVDYGVLLEMAHGGRYAIIMPTLERSLPRLKQMLDEIFGGS